jgi:hypothetical protein
MPAVVVEGILSVQLVPAVQVLAVTGEIPLPGGLEQLIEAVAAVAAAITIVPAVPVVAAS